MAKRGVSRTNGRSGASGRREVPDRGRRSGRSSDRSRRSRPAAGPRRFGDGRRGDGRTEGNDRKTSRGDYVTTEDRRAFGTRRSARRFPGAEELASVEQEPQTVFQGGDSGDIPAFLKRYIHENSEGTSKDDEQDGSERSGNVPETGRRSGRRSRGGGRDQDEGQTGGRNPRTLGERRSGKQRSGERRSGEQRSGERRLESRAGGRRTQRTQRTLRSTERQSVEKPLVGAVGTAREAADSSSSPSSSMGRLQKVLAAAGLGARRQCEDLITAGRVEVDRKVVTELGTRVDPTVQEIRVDGVVLPKLKPEYYALHKPKGFVTTSNDPSGRSRVIDLIPSEGKHLFAVGRLDMSSEGLILVTSDGDWAERITHPRYGVEKTYRVVVDGVPERSTLAQLERGVYLAEGLARVKRVTFKRRMKNQSILELVLDEGRNREIRRVLAKVGHKVHRLVRIAVGPIRLGELPVGAYRPLTKEEVRGVIDEVARRRRESRATPYERTRPPRAVQFSELREVRENTASEEERERERSRRNETTKPERKTGVRGTSRLGVGRDSNDRTGTARKIGGKTVRRGGTERGTPVRGGRKSVRGGGKNLRGRTTRRGGKRT